MIEGEQTMEENRKLKILRYLELSANSLKGALTPQGKSEMHQIRTDLNLRHWEIVKEGGDILLESEKPRD